MSLKAKNIHALILAGGKSSRFGGRDKGLVEWKSKPMVAHVIERLLGQVSGFTISCNRNVSTYATIAKHYENLFSDKQELLYLEDKLLPAYSGPLAGIYECLHYFYQSSIKNNINNHKQWPSHLMICCCDNPHLPVDIVAQLGQQLQHSNADAAFPVTVASNHYLTLLVDIAAGFTALENFKSKIKHQREFSVHGWLTEMNYTTLAIENNQGLANINSETDLKQLPNE